MKKLFSILLVSIMVLSMIFCLSGCGNKQMFDLTYTFDTAIVSLPDGSVVKGNVQSWTDFEDGDQIQVVVDDKTYLVHSSNIALIQD